MKSIIKNKLETGELQGVEDLINEYEKRAPKDLELISIKVMFFVCIGKYENAAVWARYGVRKNPYNAEVNFNLAYVNELMENYYESYKYYCKALHLAEYQKNQELLNLDIDVKIENIIQKFINNTALYPVADSVESIMQQVKKDLENGFGLSGNPFVEYWNNIGMPYNDYDGNEAYVGFYSKTASKLHEANNMILAKGEMRKIIADGKHYQVEAGYEQIIPILSESKNVLTFQENDQSYNIMVDNPNHFSHYRVKPDTKIVAENPIHIGRPIPLISDDSKKKLVLSLFVDGLSQVVLNEESIEEMMPNTYHFFSKGIICNNVHSSSDWTYPSLATYVTGLDTTNHMMVHNKLNISLPLDVTLLSEYFSQAGYHTAKIDGDWRSTPNYGYMRGNDRIIFQHQWVGMKTQEVVTDALDHMELMKDTNHYLWVEFNDLHDIADGINLYPSVESKLYVGDRVVEQGITSVKQAYSENKRKAYICQAKMIDYSLGIIYDFIEKNYKDEEILISLFSDHGQGYLVEPGKFFLSPERVNVVFMFRGGEVRPAVTDELISTADYSTIMCKLCNIAMKQEGIDGRLPKQFGGEYAREYVISESIHPNDCYYAYVGWKDYVCFFESVDSVGEDGRFHIQEGFYIQLFNYDNSEIIDEGKKNENLNIILSHIAGLIIYD